MADQVKGPLPSAQSRSSISANFAMLLDPHGVPLDLSRGSDVTLTLTPVMCCSHHSSRAEQQPDRKGQIRPLFNSAEHVSTVSGCQITLVGGVKVDAATATIPVAPNLDLTYGQLIALGGDFYGPTDPVSNADERDDQIARFKSGFEMLRSSPDEVRKILDIIRQYEFDPISACIRNNQPPSEAYLEIPADLKAMNNEDRDLDAATGGRYLKLATINVDHFGDDARTCYLAGHILAQQIAAAAGKTSDANELQHAYAVNAFADHFLTDLFASGHMRTPRRQLYNLTVLAQISGLCAKAMHDEDNVFGLWVENQRGDRWVAYGDGRYFDRCNTANRVVMKKAIQQSMDEVWQAFSTGVVRQDDSQVLDYLPKIIEQVGDEDDWKKVRDDANNWSPLFFYCLPDMHIYMRNSIDDPSDRSFQKMEDSAFAPTAVRLLGHHTLMPKAQYDGAKISYPPPAGSGMIGWPAAPTTVFGDSRVMGVSGQDLVGLKPEDWRIDSTPAPAQPKDR